MLVLLVHTAGKELWVNSQLLWAALLVLPVVSLLCGAHQPWAVRGWSYGRGVERLWPLLHIRTAAAAGVNSYPTLPPTLSILLHCIACSNCIVESTAHPHYK